jgi:hypothetical protein
MMMPSWGVHALVRPQSAIWNPQSAIWNRF